MARWSPRVSRGRQRSYVLILMVILLIPMWYYLRTTKRSMEAR